MAVEPKLFRMVVAAACNLLDTWIRSLIFISDATALPTTIECTKIIQTLVTAPRIKNPLPFTLLAAMTS